MGATTKGHVSDQRPCPFVLTAIAWNRTFPGGARASLGLTDMDIRAATPGTISTYILNSSA
jgi:hypothetical protein